AVVLLFSMATLAIAGHMLSIRAPDIFNSPRGLGIAVSVLTILTIPVFLVVGSLGKKAWVTMNVVEIPVMGVLSIIWLANGALFAEVEALVYPSSISLIDQIFCSEYRAIEALSFLTWMTLMGYAIVIDILCIVGKSRGKNVWLIGASEADYFA
ncbi:hypothetical protein L218DRAFT_825109, partial [Marasmius fiardii PR-910]